MLFVFILELPKITMAVFRISSLNDGINDVTIHQKRNKRVESSDVYHYTVMTDLKQTFVTGVFKFCELFLDSQNNYYKSKIVSEQSKLCKYKGMIMHSVNFGTTCSVNISISVSDHIKYVQESCNQLTQR